MFKKKCLAFALVMFSLLFTSSAFGSNESNWEFGAELREKIVYNSAIAFDKEAEDKGTYWAQRFSFESTYTFSDNWYFDSTILSALQKGINSNPVEQNNLDLQVVYIGYQSDVFDFKLGRQTLVLGSQRLIGWRDGTNVRRAWQGARATWKMSPDLKSDWLVLEQLEVESNGVFNDKGQSENRLAGVYNNVTLTNYSARDSMQHGLDFYYLYTNRDDRNTIEGQAKQLRHSIGLRYYGTKENWYWDWESVYQFGRHGPNNINAWTVATKTGYKFDASLNPEFMLSLNIASGDSKNGDGKLETFDALFPKGDYFSRAAILGPSNFYNAHAHFILNPGKKLTLFFDVNFYWRLETEDGVYGPPGNIIATNQNSNVKEVNLSYSTGVEWAINDDIKSELLMTYSRPREYFRLSNANADTFFLELMVNWRLF